VTVLGDVMKRTSKRSVTATRLTRLCVGLLALTIAGIAAGAFVDMKSNGMLWFFLWDHFCSAAHGGDHIVVDDVIIYYEVFGGGPPVFVLHGGLGSLVDMRHQIESLARNHLVIAPDSRGHGRSTDSAAPLSYAEMADDVRGLLDRLAIREADIVGWSDGGIIGLTLALRYPERVGRLVMIGANFDPAGLVSPPLPDPPVPPAPRLYRWTAPDPAHWPVLYRKVAAMWRTQPHFTLQELGRIRSPTLVIAGEFDIIQRAQTDTLAAAIPGAQEYIVPSATHQAPFTHPAAVNARILGFLDGSGR
jgi:pimeloyl-ACP methyl ester carboxylesterase